MPAQLDYRTIYEIFERFHAAEPEPRLPYRVKDFEGACAMAFSVAPQ